MHKVVRNTLFTFGALGLTSLGIGWNKEIAAQRQPLSVEQFAQASGLRINPDMPLQVKAQQQTVTLNQEEDVVIQTVANAKLNIVTKRPDGSTDPVRTLFASADSNGRFVLSFTINDYHSLGLFNVSVISTSAGVSNQASDQFLLQTEQEQRAADTRTISQFLP